MKNYIRYLRKQPKHIQHVHALVFAGVITAIVASIILYSDYGFWHERYQREDLITTEVATTTVAESPSEILSRFWNEARTRFGSIGSAGVSFLEGKETYTKEDK